MQIWSHYPQLLVEILRHRYDPNNSSLLRHTMQFFAKEIVVPYMVFEIYYRYGTFWMMMMRKVNESHKTPAESFGFQFRSAFFATQCDTTIKTTNNKTVIDGGI